VVVDDDEEDEEEEEEDDDDDDDGEGDEDDAEERIFIGTAWVPNDGASCSVCWVVCSSGRMGTGSEIGVEPFPCGAELDSP